MRSGLHESKWAQQPRRRTPAQQLTEDKDKCYRLLRRLYWKAEALLCSWNRAVDAIKRRGSGEAPNHLHSIIVDYATVEDADLIRSMFKLDFFEFYALLERYIVLCFDILGVRVSRKCLNGSTSSSYTSRTSSASHQFHANLLATLDEPDCPLHRALGQHDVRMYLGRAKEYRNRWKDADELNGGAEFATEGEAWTSSLEALNLATMLRTILGGLEQASIVVKDSVGVQHRQLEENARPHVSNGAQMGLHAHTLETGRGYVLNNGLDHMSMDDAPWEAVDDAMELD